MTIEEENKMIEERMRKTLNTEYKCFTVEEFKSIRRDLDRLEKLDKAIKILKQHSYIEFDKCSEFEDFKYFPVTIKENKEQECDYTIINVGSKENYDLLKEILENDK